MKLLERGTERRGATGDRYHFITILALIRGPNSMYCGHVGARMGTELQESRLRY